MSTENTPSDHRKSTSDGSPWLTVADGCRRGKHGPKPLYADIKSGKCRATTVGRAIRIHLTWYDQWLERRASGGAK